MGGDFRIEALLHPGAYPHEVGRIELVATHVSWVVLTGPYAYKVKKPVRFDFLDASTLERRAALCAEELRLNHRFAPDIYLDVVPVVRAGEGFKVGGGGPPVEYALRMRQFDPACCLPELLQREAVTAEDARQVARMLADIHARSGIAPAGSDFGRYEDVRRRVLGNIREVARDGEASLQPALARIADLAAARLQRLAPLVEARRRAGHVRECHGDLHAANLVKWRGRWTAFDCLEFDPALRWIDTLGDLAFLFMDLLAHGREDLAFEFLSAYEEEAGDYTGLALLPLHVADRALIRAKVGLLRAAGAGPEGRPALLAAAGGRIALARRWLEGVPGALVIMHGLAGSGKSTVAAQLVGRIGAVRIRSDAERRRLAGRPALSRRRQGIAEGEYSRDWTQRTYARLLRSAQAALKGGCNVIVDATFLDASHREAFRRLARSMEARFLIASCTADPQVLRARIRARASSGTDPSEATVAVLEHQLRTQHPLADTELQRTVLFDTADRDSTSRALDSVRALCAGRA